LLLLLCFAAVKFINQDFSYRGISVTFDVFCVISIDVIPSS
jgi:hypothetical protein